MMGRHQQAEASGLISFLCCAVCGGVGMLLYLQYASAFWQLSQRRFMMAAAFVAVCGVASFLVGYLQRLRSLALTGTWPMRLRRAVEILALSVVYAATLFLTSFMIFSLFNSLMGPVRFVTYIPSICAGLAGVSGYITFVQAELMDAKTLASLLPFFIISGVGVASYTSTDPNWFNNNFSQLGDRTTFAATMFNVTLILGGICVIIISYFAIAELVATYRIYRPGQPVAYRMVDVPYRLPKFKVRIVLLTILLMLSGIAFIGIGTFRYTPHPVMHNIFARGLPVIMCLTLVGLPWLAPQLSKSLYLLSDLAVIVAGATGVTWILGYTSLTNVEALAGMIFLGWFIVFSRQIAAIDDDRVQRQLLLMRQQGLDPDITMKDVEQISLDSVMGTGTTNVLHERG